MRKLLSFNYIYLLPLLLSALLSLRSFRLGWPKAYRIFSLFLILTLLIEAFAISWKWYLHSTGSWSFSRSNLWIYDGFITVRGLLIMLFYYLVLTSKLLKKLISYGVAILSVFGILNYFLIQTPHHINTHTIVLANCFIIFLALAYFRQLLRNKTLIRLNTHSAFWISLGNFIYYSGTLPFFLLFDYLIFKQPTIANSYLFINDILNILLYSLYLIAYLVKPWEQQPLQSSSQQY